MTITESNKYSRNYGIDLLRIISMYMIVIVHMMGHGGIFSNINTIWGNRVMYLIETIVICAVDVYAIISGFVGYSDKEKPYRYSKILSMWFQVVFYSCAIAILFRLIGIGNIDIVNIIKCILPVSTGAYWYFTAYFGLFFIIPFLNCMIRSCNKKDTIVLFTIIGVLFIAFPFADGLFGKDVFLYNGGYSFLWITVLYVLGALIKKCNISDKMKLPVTIVVALACVLLSWSGVVLFNIDSILLYISVTVVTFSVTLVIAFSKFRFSKRVETIIKWSTSATFGVYLIHDNTLVRNYLMKNRFVWIGAKPAYVIPLIIIGIALAILIGCLIIEKLRLWLFEKLRINKLITFISDKIKIVFDKIVLIGESSDIHH